MRAILACSAAIMLAGCGGSIVSEIENEVSRLQAGVEATRHTSWGDAGVTRLEGDGGASVASAAANAEVPYSMVIMAHDIDVVEQALEANFLHQFTTLVDDTTTHSETFGGGNAGFTAYLKEASIDNLMGVNEGAIGYLKMDGYDGYAAYYLDDAGKINVAVFGPEYSPNTTPTGTFTYKGMHLVSETAGFGQQGPTEEVALGKMVLTVDFDNGTGTLQTENTANLACVSVCDGSDDRPNGGLEIAGNITVDTTEGTFTGNALNITADTSNSVADMAGNTHDYSQNPWASHDGKTATILGNIHGSADSVTGLWYENTSGDNAAEIGGAIIGQKQ